LTKKFRYPTLLRFRGNEVVGSQVLDDLRKASPDASRADFQFIKADLSLTTGIKDACKQVLQKAGSNGINYLVQTQGMTPNGRWEETSEGIESRFAIQCLSKFGLAASLLENGFIKDSVLFVAAPGTSTKDFDGTDPGMKKAKANNKYGFFSSAARDSVVIDSMTEEFAAAYPSIKFFHVFPGLVWTSAAANSGIPFPIPQLQSLVAPLASKLIGNTPESFADLPVYLTANPAAQYPSKYLSYNLKPISLSPWASDPLHRAEVFKALTSLYNPLEVA